MSAIFGGGGKTKKPAATGLQLQTSSNAVRRPIAWGQTKVGPNIIWYNDFRAKKIKQGGKGAGPTIGYSYSASVILALCEGPVEDINNVWRQLYEKQTYSLFTTKYGAVEFLGDYTQTPWSYVATKHPTEALPYRGVAYIGIPNYSLGDQPQVPQHNVEVNAILYQTAVGGTTPDAEPAALVDDFLTNDKYGTPFSPSAIDYDSLYSGPDATTTGDSAYETYCRAMAFGLSPVLTDAEAAGKILDRWMMLTNSTVIWSGDKLKFIPFGDEQITANGVTFLPPTGIQYDLTMDDFLFSQGEDPVQYQRTDPADAKNSFYVEVMDRSNDYNLKPVPARDQASIEQLGLLQADTVKAHEIMSVQMGDTIAHLMLQRSAYVRNEYIFRLSQSYSRLEAMDVVTITVPGLGLNQYRVRVVSVEENDDGDLEMIVEDFPSGVGTTAAYATQSAQGVVYNSATAPGDIQTPIIYEPPAVLSGGVPQIWIGATGTGQFWGGCEVWFSTDDSNFYKIGDISNDVRMGVSTTGLGAYVGVNPQTMVTLGVNLSSSLGELDSADPTDAANGLTLSLLGDELLSYETATLTSAYNYDLTTLYRGLYGSSPGSHLSGSRFMRLDDTLFKYTLDPAYIGSTVYFKFPSYNSWGNALQDLSAISSYSYVLGGGAYDVTAPTSFVATGGAGIAQLSWVAPAGGIIDGYKIYAVNNHSGAFGTATLIATVAAGSLNATISGLSGGALWRYWITAYNSVEESSPAGPQDVTISAAGGGGKSPFWPTDPTPPTVAGSGLTLIQGVALSSTFTDTTRGVLLAITAGASGDRNSILQATIPGSTYVLTACLMPNMVQAQYRTFGLFLKDNTTGRIRAYTAGATNSGGVPILRRIDYTNLTTFSTAQDTGSMLASYAPVWMRLTVGSTNVTFSVSYDGENWLDIRTESKTGWTATPDRCGIWFETNPTVAPASITEYLNVFSYSLV